jgi:hypothetical protein
LIRLTHLPSSAFDSGVSVTQVSGGGSSQGLLRAEAPHCSFITRRGQCGNLALRSSKTIRCGDHGGSHRAESVFSTAWLNRVPGSPAGAREPPVLGPLPQMQVLRRVESREVVAQPVAPPGAQQPMPVYRRRVVFELVNPDAFPSHGGGGGMGVGGMGSPMTGGSPPVISNPNCCTALPLLTALRARWVTLKSSLGDAKSSLGDVYSA